MKVTIEIKNRLVVDASELIQALQIAFNGAEQAKLLNNDVIVLKMESITNGK